MKDIKMETYKEVGTAVGLRGADLADYVYYMKTRWADTEKYKCADGYAKEWAERFKFRQEYIMSDSAGKVILAEINRGVNYDKERY